MMVINGTNSLNGTLQVDHSTQGTLLVSIDGVDVYHLDKFSQPTILSSSSSLNLKLVDIPSSVLKSVPSTSQPPSYLNSAFNSDRPDQVVSETWLVLSLADGLIEIPLSSERSKSTSSIPSFQEPRSYIIPVSPGDDDHQQSPKDDHHQLQRSDIDGQIRIVFGSSVEEESLEMFDNILAGWTAYPGRPQRSQSYPVVVSPSAGDEKSQIPGYADESSGKGRLAIVDEKTGEICGELESEIEVQGIPAIGSHQPPNAPSATMSNGGPVLVALSPSNVMNQSGYSQVAKISSEPESKILSGAGWISQGILTGSEKISQFISQSGNSMISGSKPTEAPAKISPSTKATAEKIVGYTQTATKYSGIAAKAVGDVAGKVGDTIGKSTGIQRGPRGEVPSGARGYVHKGIVAISSVMDSLENGGKKVLFTAGDTARNVVTHSYGPEAGEIAGKANEGVRNVALVYIDVRGVRRRAILKSVGKAAIRGKTKDGREVIFQADEDGYDYEKKDNKSGKTEPDRLNGKPQSSGPPQAGPSHDQNPNNLNGQSSNRKDKQKEV